MTTPKEIAESIVSMPEWESTHDQVYLAGRLSLSLPGVLKLNKELGRMNAEAAMRELHGFPPSFRLRSAYAYIDAICKQRKEGAA